MVEVSIISIILTVIVTAIIGGMKFYERKYGSNPEAWDPQKFGILIGVALVVMAGEYAFGNAIAFPAEDVIVAGMSLFGMAYAIITGGKVVKTVAQNAGVLAAPSNPGFVLKRDGSKIADGLDGFWYRQCPNPDRATIPDDQNYQWVSQYGNMGVGDKPTVIYLTTDPAAAAWRQANQKY